MSLRPQRSGISGGANVVDDTIFGNIGRSLFGNNSFICGTPWATDALNQRAGFNPGGVMPPAIPPGTDPAQIDRLLGGAIQDARSAAQPDPPTPYPLSPMSTPAPCRWPRRLLARRSSPWWWRSFSARWCSPWPV